MAETQKAPPARAKRRRLRTTRAGLGPVSAVACLSMLLTGIAVTIGPTVTASAESSCATPDNEHCHSIAEDQMGHNNGMSGNIFFTCLYSPTNSDLVTNEMWDAMTGNNWIEVGVITGLDTNGSLDTRNWFWADQRPGLGFAFHKPSGFAQAQFSTLYPASITFVSNMTWEIDGGNSFVNMGMSTQQPNNTQDETAGTEFTDAQGLRDSGSVSGLRWEDSNGTIHNWGSDGFVLPPIGNNNDVTPSYSASNSAVSWADC
jgi:hypothetical protein